MRIEFEHPAGTPEDVSSQDAFHCEILVTGPDGSMRAFETAHDRVVEVEPQSLDTRFVMADATRGYRARRVRKAVIGGLGWVAVVAVFGMMIAVMTGLMQLRVISSGSMTGTYNIGDVVVVIGQDTIAPRVGDVIVFHYYNTNRSEIVGEFCHRIVSGTAADGFVTKGDANPEADISPVLDDDVIGVVVGHVPGLGWAIQPQWLIAILTILVVIALIGPVMPTRRSRSNG
jgi:signal peptidase I